ncbi:MAG: amylo-alpha-1,6-glucosidase [Bacteroidota bacterium]
MRAFNLILSSLVVLLGCGGEGVQKPERVPLELGELEVDVREDPRMYLLSDKRGGFFVGTIAGGLAHVDARWTVFGKEIIRGFELRRFIGGAPEELASGTIEPHQVQVAWKNGAAMGMLPLESPDSGRHSLFLSISAPVDHDVILSPLKAGSPGEPVVEREAGTIRWRDGSGSGELALYVGVGGSVVPAGVVIPMAASVTVLPSHGGAALPGDELRNLHGTAGRLRAERTHRLTGLLNRVYLRTSDDRLTRALNWLKLSLDALLVEGRDTFLVAGLPWDGWVDGGANALAGGSIGLATGDPRKSAGVIRYLAAVQDTSSRRSTFGRIASRWNGDGRRYSAADVTPQFVRTIYDHVTRANDTALVRSIYPVVKRAIDGTTAHHTDRDNFLVHGRDETWMSSRGAERVGPSRGNRAAEIQVLWHFQQLIGSYLASFIGEFKEAERWAGAAESTAVHFVSSFIDTAEHRVYDHLLPGGRGVHEVRPNSLLCLELLPSELVYQTMLRDVITNLLYPHGVGTLGSASKEFKAYMGLSGRYSAGEAQYNGPVATWLLSPMVYALTRYDRQDFSYPLTERMVRHILEEDMAGTLPEMFEVLARPGEEHPVAAGLRSFAPATAEFIRSFYQDYLGITTDGISQALVISPKLPSHLEYVDCTVFVGASPVHVRYQVGEAISRVALEQSGGKEKISVNFIWPMKSGDAWRGSIKLPEEGVLRLVFSAEDAVAFHGDEGVAITGKWNLRGFSRRNEFTDLRLAAPPVP